MRRFLAAAVLGALALAACQGDDSPTGTTPIQPDLAVARSAQNDRYIVVYGNRVSDTRAEINRHAPAMSPRVERVFQHTIRGWSGRLTPTEVSALRADPDVAFVEADQPVEILTTQTPTPSWGLDRIDQVSLPLNNSYTFSRTGAGVHFYGIDTGILYTHVQFGGRASFGFDAVSPSTNGVDCHGHGTHTASTAAGGTYGVARGMTIVGVRVLDCTGHGLTSNVIAGIDWVTQHAIKPAVANMSLGGGHSNAMDAAVNASIASGVVFTVASGNGDGAGNPQDACTVSPADVTAALTVNASNSSDARSTSSNYGSCTDLYAPGVGILGAYIGSNTASVTSSGTSMAAPHVAGVVGLYLEANPTATPAQVAAAILGNADLNKITNPLPNTPNRLLYMGFIGGGAVNQPPVAAITAPAANASFVQGASVSFAGTGTDPEQGALSGAALTWTSSRDGAIGTGTGFAKSNLTVGTHVITLTAKDAQNATGTASRTITITAPPVNHPPVAAITAPAANASFVQGATISFAGTGTDPEQGALSGTSLTWTSSRDGTIGTGTGFTKSNLSVGTHVITLTARDAQNAAGSASRTITVTAAPGNQAPVANFTVNCVTGWPHRCSFDASSSTDDVGIVSYLWNWGTTTTTTTVPTVLKGWEQPVTRTITLTVKDAGGLTSSITKVVVVP